MKISAKTNFSFEKLASALPNMISEIIQDTVKSSAKESRNAIKSGVNPPLEDSTIAVRKLRGISGNTPLLATGNLYNSIRANEDKLEFVRYGKYHREGFIPKYIPAVNKFGEPYISDRAGNSLGGVAMMPNIKGINVPPRNFARIGKLKTKDFQNKIIKALRK